MVRLDLSLEGSLSANISTVIMIMVSIEDGGDGAIDVNSAGRREYLNKYCGSDYHDQNIYDVHDVIFMMMMMVMMMICVG